VHLVGFFIRIYHDARSSECQIPGDGVEALKYVGVLTKYY